MRRSAAVIIALALAAASASAKSAPQEIASERQMVASNIVTPVVRNGKLVNYLFVTVEVTFADKANAIRLRDRAHFLRDALLRASHRAQLADPAQDDKLNTAAAEAQFRIAADEALGGENVGGVKIVGVDSLRRR